MAHAFAPCRNRLPVSSRWRRSTLVVLPDVRGARQHRHRAPARPHAVARTRTCSWSTTPAPTAPPTSPTRVGRELGAITVLRRPAPTGLGLRVPRRLPLGSRPRLRRAGRDGFGPVARSRRPCPSLLRRARRRRRSRHRVAVRARRQSRPTGRGRAGADLAHRLPLRAGDAAAPRPATRRPGFRAYRAGALRAVDLDTGARQRLRLPGGDGLPGRQRRRRGPRGPDRVPRPRRAGTVEDVVCASSSRPCGWSRSGACATASERRGRTPSVSLNIAIMRR